MEGTRATTSVPADAPTTAAVAAGVRVLAVEAEIVKLLVLSTTVSEELVLLSAVVIAPDATTGSTVDSDVVGEDAVVTFVVVAAKMGRVEAAGTLTFTPAVEAVATAAATAEGVETVLGGPAMVEAFRVEEAGLTTEAFGVAGLSPAVASVVLEGVGRAAVMAAASDEVPCETWEATALAAATPPDVVVAAAAFVEAAVPTAAAVTLPVGGALKLVKPITGAAAAAMEGAAVDEVPSAGIVVETTGAAAAALLLVAPATSATVAIDGVVVAMVGAAAVAAVGVAASEAETTGAARVAPTELAFSTVTGGAAELMFEATAAVEMLNAAVATTKQSIMPIARRESRRCIKPCVNSRLR